MLAVSRPITHSVAYTRPPVTFFDILTPAGHDKLPIVLVHGGAHTGACYLSTVTGRPGWAQFFAQRGHKVVIPDWPGCGRSGHVPYESLTGQTVCEGIGAVIEALGGPVILLTHSMSGPYGWRLVEMMGDRIDRLIAIAPGPPGNIQPVAPPLVDIDSQTAPADPMNPKSSVSQAFVVDLRAIEKKFVGGGDQFPRPLIARYAASLQPVAPRLVTERMNIAGSQLKVADFGNYHGKRMLIVIGTHDIDHTVTTDGPIVAWLNSHGANAELLALGDEGIMGNGHMMMIEANSDDIAECIYTWLNAA